MKIKWNNLDTMEAFKKLQKLKNAVSLKDVLSGDDGAERVKKYSIPIANGLFYNYAAKSVNDQILSVMQELADEAQLIEKFQALYEGEIINTGENRKVLHHLTRGQLGKPVLNEGNNLFEFYNLQQKAMPSLQ